MKANPSKAALAKVVRRRAFAMPPLLPNPDALPGLPAGPKVVLPYPPYALNPNCRSMHPARKAGVAKRYRETCWGLVLERFGVAGRLLGLPDEPAKVTIHLDFFPPRRGARDDDNAEAAFKAGRDGVASALRVDDSRFVVSRTLHDHALGCVVATFTGASNA